jgi:hypothetical protein
MPKEWVLNQALNRWGLNKKSQVGPVSELIRTCAPSSLDEWRTYYFEHGRKPEHLDELGRRLFVKITEIIQPEVAEIRETDCISYVHDVVLNRTFVGYQTEIKTVYGQLQDALGRPVKPAPDEWDRRFHVDFFVEAAGRMIGIQIKPVSFGRFPQDYAWFEMHRKAHAAFEAKMGGKVFTVFSHAREGGRKDIVNPEVIEQIKAEIVRLNAGN